MRNMSVASCKEKKPWGVGTSLGRKLRSTSHSRNSNMKTLESNNAGSGSLPHCVCMIWAAPPQRLSSSLAAASSLPVPLPLLTCHYFPLHYLFFYYCIPTTTWLRVPSSNFSLSVNYFSRSSIKCPKISPTPSFSSYLPSLRSSC